MWKALRSRNACKTCALGMGGQRGGMVNEMGRFPEVCKKSVQAMAADLQGEVPKEFFETISIEQMQAMTSRELEHSGRLTQPMYCGPLDDRYRPISWEDAIDRIAAKATRTEADDSFWYFSGRSSNEAGFLLQLIARLYGTNNINNCSFYCHQASGVGLSSVTGSGTATIVLEDLEHCDCVFLIGANPASNHPRLMKTLVEIRRRGGKVIVINPLREGGLVRFKVPSDVRSMLFASKIADIYVQPNIGGDCLLMAGIIKALCEHDGIDRTFVTDHAQGWEAFESMVSDLSWDAITKGSGVDRGTIEEVAAVYTGSTSAVFCWAMGMTHHLHGVKNVQMIGNLAIARGMLGRPGSGLLPLRGHSNVQGIGSVGVVPKLKKAVVERLESHFGVTLPTTGGMDTMACMEASDQGKVRLAVCLGGNLYGSNPDAKFATKAMSKIDTVVYLSTKLNTGHAWGRGGETIILPVLARDEEPETTTQESMFNYVRFSEGGSPRHKGPRSEVDVIASLGRGILGDDGPLDFASIQRHKTIREAIAAIVPGYEEITTVDTSGKEFQIPGRTFHTPHFNTPSGKASVHTFDPPAPARLGTHQLRLATLRSEGQFNTVVYEETDRYRGQRRRDIIMMNSGDIDRMGLCVDQSVTIRGGGGDMSDILVKSYDIAPGNAAMYYPEVNAILSREVDPHSRTPAFKGAIIEIVGV
jgi:molybdopterin-dependent oxidoreductase alpha subunit